MGKLSLEQLVRVRAALAVAIQEIGGAIDEAGPASMGTEWLTTHLCTARSYMRTADHEVGRIMERQGT